MDPMLSLFPGLARLGKLLNPSCQAFTLVAWLQKIVTGVDERSGSKQDGHQHSYCCRCTQREHNFDPGLFHFPVSHSPVISFAT